MQHGDFSSMEMQLLAKAAAAKAVGKSASLETDIALAAPLKSISGFRTGPGESRLKDEQLVHLKKALKEIRFRDDSTHGDIKTLKIDITNARVLPELAAVLEVIPTEYEKYSLIQWGHGDLQVISINEGQIIGEPYSSPGLWSAIRYFQKITGLEPSEAQRAFRTGFRYNGKMTAKISCEDEIRQSIQHHILTDMAPILNNIKKNDQKNVVVSGGSVHEKVAMEILKNECSSRSLKLHEIQDLEGVDVDPVFTCLAGLRKFGKLRLDIGHSALKAELEF
ncbi:MAG: hypothetical protein EOP04_04730 [Proteobacteria bacterium]|nr:MAG: hypothetical protein EOP04_04730 [Pseudomonadota bacterium]